MLTGNPGTGKSTAARIVARYLHAYGVLPSETVVERNALLLKGQYVGQSAPRVAEAVADAMGGVLFIDEAYALAGNDGYGTEVVRTLLTELENNRTRFVCILAGYDEKMGHLMAMDPGLQRRFPTTLRLSNYTPAQLALIAEGVACRSGFQLDSEVSVGELGEHIGQRHSGLIASHNGGLAVQLVEAAIGRLMVRVVDEELSLDGPAGTRLGRGDFEMPPLELASLSRHGELEAGQGEIPADLRYECVKWNNMRLEDFTRPVEQQPVEQAVDMTESMEVQEALDRARARKAVPAPRWEDMLCVECAEECDEECGSFGSGGSSQGDSLYDEEPGPADHAAEQATEGQVAHDAAWDEEEMELSVPKSKSNQSSEKKRQKKLQAKGPCPAGYDWRRRKGCFTEPCMKCGKQPNDGYQCSAGSHWLCMKCTNKL